MNTKTACTHITVEKSHVCLILRSETSETNIHTFSLIIIQSIPLR
uniref:Uncharacterized protein n=1 Tax=Anguilla anguilla TaxID=7936 RepID=A0A0E9PLC5_ANGAN